MGLPFTDIEAREAIAAIVTVASGSEKVYSFNCLDYQVMPDGNPDFSEWPGLFTYGSDGNTIHGWVIKRTERPADLRDGCEEFTWGYDIWGFYKFAFDAYTENETNSDNEFSTIVEAVAAAFNQGEGNGLIEINETPAQHFGLQFPMLSILRAGQVRLHFAGGHLEILGTT